MVTPNIILITIDSLRVDHLGCYGYPQNTSPSIDSLASKGALFLEAISNGGATASAFPSILASARPPIQEVEGKAILQRSATLAEVLKSAGYQTAAFHSNPMLSRFYGYGKGFDVFDDSFRQFSPKGMRLWIRTRPKSPDNLMAKALRKVRLILKPILTRVSQGHIISAEEITSKSMLWLETHKEKFFLWLHYMDVHHPYLPLPQYIGQFHDQPVSRKRMASLYRKMLKDPGQLSPSEVATLIDLYDADIRYVDDNIGSLLASLAGDLANTIVIVTTDHGDEFGEHGKFGHQSLHDGVVRVPLIIAGPGIKAGTVIREPIELLDLAPTVADFIGIESPPRFHGKSLLPVIGGKSRVATGAISTVTNKLEQRFIAYRTPEWKYIRTESPNEANTMVSEEVYDLRNDPKERHNMHGSEDEEARAFELEAVNKILEFKRLKSEEKTAYEKERIRAKFKKLPKL